MNFFLICCCYFARCAIYLYWNLWVKTSNQNITLRVGWDDANSFWAKSKREQPDSPRLNDKWTFSAIFFQKFFFRFFLNHWIKLGSLLFSSAQKSYLDFEKLSPSQSFLIYFWLDLWNRRVENNTFDVCHSSFNFYDTSYKNSNKTLWC